MPWCLKDGKPGIEALIGERELPADTRATVYEIGRQRWEGRRMDSYECVIYGGPVDKDVIVNVFISPPDGSWDRDEGTPYMLSISPCCGERACVEAAWEQVKKATIGHIELKRALTRRARRRRS